MTKSWELPQPASDQLKRMASGEAPPKDDWKTRFDRTQKRQAEELAQAWLEIADMKRRILGKAKAAFEADPNEENYLQLASATQSCLAVSYASGSGKVDFKIVDNSVDMRTMPYKEYLQTDHWKEKREEALFAAKYECLICCSKKRLEVHHRTYERRGCELLSDLAVLCHDCHTHFHRTRTLSHD